MNKIINIKHIFLCIGFTFQFLFPFDESVAILDFEAINLRESDVDALTQRLSSEIINLNKFIVLERHSI